jgi:hypothetical protein
MENTKHGRNPNLFEVVYVPFSHMFATFLYWDRSQDSDARDGCSSRGQTTRGEFEAWRLVKVKLSLCLVN